MNSRVRVLVGAVGVAGLAGCGGGGSFEETLAARGAVNNAMVDRLDAKFNTAFTAMPTTGSATYNGFAIFQHSDGTKEDMEILGDAAIQADFATGTVTGQATNFGGYHNDGAVGAYAGSLALTDGLIGINRPNDLDTFFNGTLTRDADTLVVDGYAIGDFRGTPIAGVSLYTDDTTSTVTINGGAPLPIYGGFHGED